MNIRRSGCVLGAFVVCTAFVWPSHAGAQQLINSWENSVEGWGVASGYASAGFVTTVPPVTNGTYAWGVSVNPPLASGTQDPGNYAFVMGGTASTAITALLAQPGQTISIDVYAPGGSFNYQQWDLTSNNSGSSGAYAGYQSLDGYSFPQSPVIGTETTLSWTVPLAASTYFAANPSTTTSINFQIGGTVGAGTQTFYVDNLRASIAVPEPASLALLCLGGLGLVGMTFCRRR